MSAACLSTPDVKLYINCLCTLTEEAFGELHLAIFYAALIEAEGFQCAIHHNAYVLIHACAGNEGITAHYNNVALASLPANTSLYDTAHFFAIFNTAQFDGRIAYFTMKYDNLFWRPITAAYQLIRSACPLSLF